MLKRRSLRSLSTLLARNTASNGVFFLLQQVVSLCGYIVLIRLLPLEEYGLLMLVGVILGQFAIFDAGLSTGLEKFLPEYRAAGDFQRIARGIGVTIIFFLIVGTLCATFLFIVAATNAGWVIGVDDGIQTRNVFVTAGVIALIHWPLQSLKSACRGFNLHHSLNKIQFLVQATSVCATVLAVVAQIPLYWVVIFLYLPSLGGAIAEWHLLGEHAGGERVKFDSQSLTVFQEMFGYSVWVFLIKISSELTNRFDRMLVSALLGVSALPIYYGVMRVMKFPVQINSVLKRAVLPVASEVNKTHNAASFSELGYRGLRIFNAVYAQATFFVIIFAYPITSALGGSRLAEYAWAVQLGGVLLLPVAGRAFYNEMLIGSGEFIRQQALWSVVMAVVYMVILMVGIRYVEIAGALVAHPIAHLIMMVWWLHLIARRTNLGIGGLIKGMSSGQWPTWFGVIAFWLVYRGLLNEFPNRLLLYSVLIYAAVAFVTWKFSVEPTVRARISQQIHEMFHTAKQTLGSTAVDCPTVRREYR